MNPKSLAIVLGTYNRLEHLKRCVASVELARGNLRPTLIIVDGGSTDGTVGWLMSNPFYGGHIHVIRQEGPLTGAVKAFNLGFGEAVDRGFDYVAHFNDDAEYQTEGMLERAVEMMEEDPKIGDVAFEFDLRGPWGFDEVNGRIYSNFGVIRREAGMAVARAQGDPSGRAWWNPIYHTYGADSELGCWLYQLGWTIEPGFGLRAHDCNAKDAMRSGNEAANNTRGDGRLFWERWPNATYLIEGSLKGTRY